MLPARLLLAPLAVIVALATPSMAPAATVTFTTKTVEGYKTSTSTYGTTRFAADPGEVNTLTVSLEDRRVVMRDATAPVRAGSGCEQIDAHTARCAVPAFGLDLSNVVIDVLDGDDLVDAAAVPDVDGYGEPRVYRTAMKGGSGEDKLIGAASGDELDGADGDDVLEGRDGDDVLVGGAGRDRLMAGEGVIDVLFGDAIRGAPAPDLLDGGPGGQWSATPIAPPRCTSISRIPAVTARPARAMSSGTSMT